MSFLARVIKEADYIIQNAKRKKDAVLSAAGKKAKTLSKIYYSSSKKTKELLDKTAKAFISIAKSPDLILRFAG